MIRVAIAVMSVALALAVAGTAAAHPDAPWRTVAWAKKSVFQPGSFKFDDRSITCTGVPEGRKGVFRHFLCITTRNDDARFSQVIHTTNGPPDDNWTFSDLKLIGGVAGYEAKTFAKQTVSGDFPVVVASGSIDAPERIQVQAIASPDQPARVSWTIVCSRSDASGIGAASRSGTYTEDSRVEHTIPFPFRRPDTCTVAASASLASSGTVTIRVIAYR